jgi:hypothetical protein
VMDPSPIVFSCCLLLLFIQLFFGVIQLLRVQLFSNASDLSLLDCICSVLHKDNSKPKHGTKPASTCTHTRGSCHPSQPHHSNHLFCGEYMTLFHECYIIVQLVPCNLSKCMFRGQAHMHVSHSCKAFDVQQVLLGSTTDTT